MTSSWGARYTPVLSNRNKMLAIYETLNFLVVMLKKAKIIGLIFIFYLTQCI